MAYTLEGERERESERPTKKLRRERELREGQRDING